MPESNPELPIDPPEERDFEAEEAASQREDEARFEMWREEGYPERRSRR